MKRFAIATVTMSIMLSASAAMANKGWEEKFDKADTNNDGMISLQEYNVEAREKFVKMDTDGDNMISMEEKKAFKEMKHDDKRD